MACYSALSSDVVAGMMVEGTQCLCGRVGLSGALRRFSKAGTFRRSVGDAS